MKKCDCSGCIRERKNLGGYQPCSENSKIHTGHQRMNNVFNMLNNLKIRILKKIIKFSIKKHQKLHLLKHKNDIRCTNCSEWYSTSGIFYKHHIEDTDFGVKTKCGQCSYISYWNLEIAPAAIKCNSEGIPV